MAVVTSLGFSIFSTFNGKGMQKAARTLGAVTKAAAIAGLGLTALGSASILAGATVATALATIPLLFGAIAVVAAASSDKVKEAYSGLGTHVMEGLAKAAKPVVPVLVRLADKAAHAFDRMLPTISALFAAIAPMIERLGDAIIQGLEYMLPAFLRIAQAMTPVWNAFTDGITALLKYTAQFLEQLAAIAPRAGQAFAVFITSLGSILRFIGRLLVAMTKLGIYLLPAVAAVFNTIGFIIDNLVVPAFGALQPLWDQIARLAGRIAAGVAASGSKLKAFALTVFSSILAIIRGAVPFIMALVDLIVNVAIGVAPLVGALVTGASKVLQFLAPVITWLLGKLTVLVQWLDKTGIATKIASGLIILWVTRATISFLIAVGKWVVGTAMMIARTAVWATITVGSWAMTAVAALRSAATHTAAFFVMIAGWIKSATVATISATRHAIAWLLMRARALAGSAAILIAFTVMNAGWYKSVAVAIVSSARMAAVWVLIRIRAIAGAIAQGIAFAISNAGWILAATIAMINAIRIAAAWLIAMGPVGIVIAIVIALVALIILNWDKIKRWTIAAWNAIVSYLTAAWALIKRVAIVVWNALKSYLSAVWNGIKAVALAIWNPVKNFFTRMWSGVTKAFSQAWYFIKTILTGAWNGIKLAALRIWGYIKSSFLKVWTPVANAFRAVWSAIRNFVVGVWNYIKNSAVRIWNGLKNFFIRGVVAQHKAITSVWNAIKGFLSRIWNGIKNAAMAVWNAIKNYFVGNFNRTKRAITDAWGAARNYMMRAWNFLKSKAMSIWNAVKNFFVGMFNRVRRVATDAWGAIRNYLWRAWKFLHDQASRFWNAIKRIFQAVWGAIRSAVSSAVNFIKDRWNNLKDAAKWVFDKIKGFVQGFRDKFNAVKTSIGNLVDKIKGYFGDLKDTAGDVFDQIKTFVTTPIKWVIDHVYNGGIVKFWNSISDKLFGGDAQLGKVSTDGWARGGRVSGNGTHRSDSVMARLSKGEHVLTAKEVKGFGGHGRVAAMRSAARGGRAVSMGPGTKPNGRVAPQYFGGGIVDSFTKGVGGAFEVSKDMFSDIKEGDFFEALGKYSDYISDIIPDVSGLLKGITGHFNMDKVKPFYDMMKKGMDRAINAMTAYLTNLLGFGGGDGPGDWKAMFRWVKTIDPGTKLMSGFRRGDPGYHGKGQAIDMAWPDGSERRGGGRAEKVFNAIVARWKSSIAELIWDYSPYGYGVGVYNGKEHKFHSATSRPPSHNDHIHWASTAGSMGLNLSGLQGGNVNRWKPAAAQALRLAGVYSAATLAGVLETIRQESGGNPRAQNNWDINARNGVPSKGLMQVIPPTFNAFAGPLKSRGIWDPVANIYAAVKYAINRYGIGSFISRMTAPGGYNLGGAVSYDQGGYLQPGYTLVHNGTGRPEPVGHDLIGGGNITVNINGTIMGDRRAIKDAVIQGINDAKREGRLPK